MASASGSSPLLRMPHDLLVYCASFLDPHDVLSWESTTTANAITTAVKDDHLVRQMSGWCWAAAHATPLVVCNPLTLDLEANARW